MRNPDEHVLIPTLKRQLVDRLIDRREFVRYAALLGMSATAAYAFVRKVTGEPLVAPAAAQALPKGGVLRIGMRCQDLKSPHTYSWVESSNSARQVLDYLTTTGVDNVTRPSLVEKWEASPDLKTWTLRLRRNVKWHSGRQFTADDVVWNLKRVLDPKTGSSVLGRDRREGRQGQREEVDAALGRQRHPESRYVHGEAQRQDRSARRARAALPLSAADPRPGRER